MFAKFGGSCYILTASHVVEDWSNNNPLFISIPGGYISIVGKASGYEIDKSNRIDTAYIKLNEAIASVLKQDNKFLGIDRIRGHINLLNEAQYCIFGYPTVLQKRDEEQRVLKTKGLAHFARPSHRKVLEHYRLDSRSHYVMEIKRKGKNIKTGIEEKIHIEYYGMSGCGLWLLLVNHDGEKFISQAKLIGIMTEFRKGKYECLIGNRIELLLISLQDNEGLKFRGKPATFTR